MFLLLQQAFANPSALTSAMNVPASDIQYQNLNAHSMATEVSSSLGIINPTDGSSMAQLYTGSIGSSPQPGMDLGYTGSQGYDQATLTLTLLVPPNQNSFSFDFNFLSAEYPEFVGMIYNDTFEANITGSAFTGNAAICFSRNGKFYEGDDIVIAKSGTPVDFIFLCSRERSANCNIGAAYGTSPLMNNPSPIMCESESFGCLVTDKKDLILNAIKWSRYGNIYKVKWRVNKDGTGEWID